MTKAATARERTCTTQSFITKLLDYSSVISNGFIYKISKEYADLYSSYETVQEASKHHPYAVDGITASVDGSYQQIKLKDVKIIELVVKNNKLETEDGVCLGTLKANQPFVENSIIGCGPFYFNNHFM